MKHTLLILAGGASSRMKNSASSALSTEAIVQANTASKALITLNERPMLDYILRNAKKAGITNVILVTGVQNQGFKKHYGNEPKGNKFNGLTISYAVQKIPEFREKPFGTADAVFQATEQFTELQTETFLVCNCDNLYSTSAFKALLDDTHSNAFINYNRNALHFSEERIASFALTKISPEYFLEHIIEKPRREETSQYKNDDGTFRVSMNIWKFNGAQFYPYLKNCEIHPQRNEKELPAAVLKMVENQANAVKAIPFSEAVPDLTGKDDIIAMNSYLSTHYPNFDWSK